MSKTLTTILGLAFLGIIIFVAVKFPGPVQKPQELASDQSPKDTAAVDDGTYCYTREQVASAENPYTVKENVNLTISGAEVTGIKEGTQSGPDMMNGYQGVIVGAKDGSMLDVLFSYEIEGSEQSEQEFYFIGKDMLTKFRLPLNDVNGILVPDKTAEPQLLMYRAIDCASIQWQQ